MLKAKLVVIGGVAKAAEIPLNLPTVIGRGREANLTLPHPLVSRQHCELYEQDGKLHVRDLQSLNGTYVDSQRIETCAPLRSEQLLTIGDVTFRALYSSEDASVAELTAHTSNVIEIDNANSSPESDSEIDGQHDTPVHNRPTVRGPQKKPAAVTQQDPGDLLKTVHSDGGQSSNVLGSEQPTGSQPQQSVVAALQGLHLPPSERAAASLSELQAQLPESSPAKASSIDGLPMESADNTASCSGISRLELQQAPAPRVSAEESALDSFIRKLPR